MRFVVGVVAAGSILIGVTPAQSGAPRGEPIERVASTVRYWELSADIFPFDCDVVGLVVTAHSSSFDLDDEDVSAEVRTPRGPLQLPVAVKPSATLDDRFLEVARDDHVNEKIPVELHLRGRLYETRIDEALARNATWPQQPWSPALAPYLLDEPLIEASSPEVTTLVRRWAGHDPKRARPYDLAKYLAAHVIDHVTLPPLLACYIGSECDPGFYGVGVDDTKVLHGILEANADRFVFSPRNEGAIPIALTGVGTRFEMVSLLTAVYRAAGIPARMVIGFDAERSDRCVNEYALRAWTEFFLPWNVDPNADAVTLADGRWIPVDITRQEETSNRSHPLNARWTFFGNNDELDQVFPIAAHWVSPSEFSRRCELPWPPVPALYLVAADGIPARPALRARQTAVPRP